MVLKVTEEIKDVHGDVIQRPVPGKSELVPATLRYVCAQALVEPIPGVDQTLSSEEKIKNYALAKKIVKNDECELTVDDAARIKDRVAKMFPTAVFGPVSDALEGISNGLKTP